VTDFEETYTAYQEGRLPFITPAKCVLMLGHKPQTLGELKFMADILASLAKNILGPRGAVIVMLGQPDPQDEAHDIFVAQHRGSCLTQRGLFAWGERNIPASMDRAETK